MRTETTYKNINVLVEPATSNKNQSLCACVCARGCFKKAGVVLENCRVEIGRIAWKGETQNQRYKPTPWLADDCSCSTPGARRPLTSPKTPSTIPATLGCRPLLQMTILPGPGGVLVTSPMRHEGRKEGQRMPLPLFCKALTPLVTRICSVGLRRRRRSGSTACRRRSGVEYLPSGCVCGTPDKVAPFPMRGGKLDVLEALSLVDKTPLVINRLQARRNRKKCHTVVPSAWR